MQIRRIWEFWGIRMTRSLQYSKQQKDRPQPANFKAGQWTVFFVPPIHIWDYACFVYQSLLVMVIALVMSRIMRKIVCRLWQNKISQQ